jgi:two-component system, OmpR family, sensor kinase
VRLPGGIRARLALSLTAIVAGALGTAYLIVVPSLERQLVDARLDRLEAQIGSVADDLPGNRFDWDDAVERFAARTNARVVIFQTLSMTPPTVTVLEDSRRGEISRDVTDDPVALRAVTSDKPERGRVTQGAGDFAEVAVAIDDEFVILLRASLADSLATVRLVQRRLLLATAFALALALALGLTAAGMLAHRIRRLESAAERIAAGDFDVPIVDRGDDEIGQLAGAFDQMRVRLAQLDNARKEFVANASHELRTPLFSLGGFLELLLDEELDEDTRREFLTTMHGQVDRLTKLSTDLLDLSRVDAGQLDVLEEPVDLGHAARIVGDELERVAVTSGHELEVDARDAAWAVGDFERVVQIGRALAVNALTHTPGGSRVVVRAGRQGDRAQLTVEDGGPGVPREHQTAVFERFYRVEGGMASGSGLGLSIARELARLMNGTVTLESRPGRTIVTLELPATDAPTRDGGTPFSRENESEAVGPAS